MLTDKPRTVLLLINVGWYFKLHWLDRAVSFRQEGYRVIVMCNWRSDLQLMSMVESMGIQCIQLDLARRKASILIELKAFFTIFYHALRIRPNILHSATVKPNLYGGLVASMLRIPFVCSITGLGVAFSSSQPCYLRLKSFILLMYRCIANSTYSRFLFENRSDLNLFVSAHILPIARAVQIAGAGVDIYKYFPQPEPDAACIKVLFAARLLKEKGLDDLVCAVKTLQNRGCIIKIYVAGIHDEADPDAIPFSQICEWQEKGYLQWLGTRNDMSNVIGDCHIVCLPTRYAEGTPRILIEGASCGRPLIAPNVPGCNEIIEDGINGLLYATSGSPSLVECLSMLAKSPSTRTRMGVAGRYKVERCYSHQKVVSSTLEVYSALC